MRPLACCLPVACCSTSGRVAGSPPTRHRAAWIRPSQRQSICKHACRATEDGQPEKSGDQDADAAEARLEAYERGAKRRQGSRAVADMERRAARRKADLPAGGMAEWPEGQLLPSGWDDMDFGRRAAELYTGKRGLLFWFNKAAYASIFIILGGWVVFRFVLPALGLYSLTNDLSSPTVP